MIVAIFVLLAIVAVGGYYYAKAHHATLQSVDAKVSALMHLGRTGQTPAPSATGSAPSTPSGIHTELK